MGIYNQNQFGFPTWAAEGGRIGRAYGGIMDSSTGRRAYGIGSFFKSIGKAAKKIIKSPIGKIGIGALAMGMPLGGGAWFGAGSGWGKMAPYLMGTGGPQNLSSYKGGLLKKIFGGGKGALASGWNPWKIGIGAAGVLPFLMGGGDDDDDKGFDYEGAKNAYRDELMRIKAGAMAGTLDPNKFNYLGVKDGGRIGYYKGGQSIPSDYTLEDAEISTAQDKLSGITEAMKHADLYRSGDVGQFYAAQGGRIGYAGGGLGMDEIATEFKRQFGYDMSLANPDVIKEFIKKMKEESGEYDDVPMAQGGRIGYGAGGQTGRPPINLIKGNDQPVAQTPAPMSPNQNKPMNPMMARGNPMMNSPMMNRPMMNPMGGRRMAQEGGLMDLGGMEKDYRQDGGFVPIGGKEKADDVPARLSKNEFVFTADAVRGAGGGDIDKGAEIMENVMENLENGGNISEESQGLEGARNMFATSQRLGGVI
jgi:hypothetical protein